MNLELHILQNFAPSNLNRDDTGSPKSCEFGGTRRARISSQCLKRAIREEFKRNDLVPAANRAERTKRVIEMLVELLPGRDPMQARAVAEQALAALEIKPGDPPKGENPGLKDLKTQYLVFLGANEAAALAEFCNQHWDALLSLAPSAEDAKGKAKDKKAGSKEVAEKVGGKAVVEALKKKLDGGRAADLALFGRMLADLPEQNVHAASQVAHALSTHTVGLEFDYYTAVDDRKPDDNAGADMIGTIEFNSACYYRYANIDLGQLGKNLGGDRDLVRRTIDAFLQASRDAEPTGKQNSFAARNRPSFVLAVVREGGFSSLANAFARPVRPGPADDIVKLSVAEMARHWDELAAMYGRPAGETVIACGLTSTGAQDFGGTRVASYAELIEGVLAACEPAFKAA